MVWLHITKLGGGAIMHFSLKCHVSMDDPEHDVGTIVGRDL